MNESVTTRAYQDVDREDCRSLWRGLVEWHREIYADSSIGGEHPEDYFDKHLAKIAADNIWVALRGSRTVGFVGLSIEGNEAEAESLIVAKSCRNEGIGSQLIQTVVSEARKRGTPFLNVRHVTRNEEAIKFLSKQGLESLVT